MKCTVDSLLTDSSIRWTPLCNRHLELAPVLISLLTLNYLTLYKTDTSLRWAVSACWSQSWFWRELSINAGFKVMIELFQLSVGTVYVCTCLCFMETYGDLANQSKIISNILFVHSLSIFPRLWQAYMTCMINFL